MFQAFLYDADGHDREIQLDFRDPPELSEHRILWIDVTAPDEEEVGKLKRLLGWHPDLARAVGEGGATILSNYGEYFHCAVTSLQTGQPTSDNTPSIPVGVDLKFVVGPNWLVTVADKELSFLPQFRDRDRGETLIGRLSSGALAASLLDQHLSTYLEALEALEGWLDVLDVRLLASKAADRTLLKGVVSARRVVSRLRRYLAAQRTVFYGLARPDFALVADTDAKEAFVALEQRYDRAMDAVEHSRELVRGSFDLFATRIAESTNVLIRRLTFVSIALGGVGAVAGIFGMNFHMPLFETGAHGFWGVLGILITAIAVGYAVSKSRGWV